MSNNKIKVLHILGALLPSGAETMLFSSAGYWNPDYEIHLLATAKERGSYASELERAGYIVHHIYNDNYFKHHNAVRRFIKKEEFDIVHVHKQAEACSYAWDAKLGGAKRIVRTVHNVFVFHGLVQIREKATRHIACRLGVQHVAISPSVRENEKRRFGIETVEIRNWYDENRFYFTTQEMRQEARTKLRIAEDAFCLLSVGNCTPVKNHMSILKALEENKDDSRFDSVIYLHVGHGMQEDEEKDFVSGNGMEKHVRFFGFDDPAPYLQAADLYVMPSTYEGFGISAVEALATGLPCIFTDVPGLEDFKENHFDNLQFCELNDDAIEEAIKNAVISGKKENSMAQAQKVKQLYGIEGGVKQYEAVYNGRLPEIIGGGIEGYYPLTVSRWNPCLLSA